MIRFQKLFIILCIIINSTSQATILTPFNSVQNLFAGISEFNDFNIKAEVTDDFKLLEDGEVWDIDMLIKAIKPTGDAYTRRNYFSLINVVSKNDVVWISYWNKATFLMQGKSNDVTWLESVVIIKEKEKWKIQLMHSTKLEPKQIPMDVEFIEYIR
jgi:hypothetical protein